MALSMSVDEITGVVGVSNIYKKEEKHGVATITRYKFEQSKDLMFNLRAVRDGGGMFRMYDGEYVRMHIGGQLMMSDTAMERISNSDFIHNAKGDVFIAGLGIGLIIKNIIDKPEVTSITVIERYQDVIDLVEPKLRHPKLKVVCANIFMYEPAQKYDTIYFDIWAEISTENLEQINFLHRKFRKYKKDKTSYLNSWMFDFLKRRKRKDDREELNWHPLRRLTLDGYEDKKSKPTMKQLQEKFAAL